MTTRWSPVRWTLALAMAWLTGGLAIADQREGHSSSGADMDRMAILLDLNDGQKTAVQEVLQQQHDKMHASHEAQHAAGTRPTREEMTKLHEQMKQETVTKLQSVLTPEQIKKFEALTDGPPHSHGGREL